MCPRSRLSPPSTMTAHLAHAQGTESRQRQVPFSSTRSKMLPLQEISSFLPQISLSVPQSRSCWDNPCSIPLGPCLGPRGLSAGAGSGRCLPPGQAGREQARCCRTAGLAGTPAMGGLHRQLSAILCSRLCLKTTTAQLTHRSYGL